MMALRWLVMRCLHLAASRWPVARRAEKLREWLAELDWLARQPRSTWAQLRFGWSLAMSPVMPQATTLGTRPVRPIFALATALVICIGMVGALPMAVWSAMAGILPALTAEALMHVFIPSATIVTAITVPFLMGRWIGRRMPMLWAHRGRLGQAGSAATAPVILAAGMAIFLPVSAPPSMAASGQLFPPNVMPGLVIWAVLTTVVAIAVVKYASAGRRWLAMGMAVIGSFVVLDISVMAMGWHNAAQAGVGTQTAPIWLPASLLSAVPVAQPFAPWFTEEMIQSTFWTARGLLAASALVLGFGLAAARSAGTVTTTATDRVTAAWPRAAWAGAALAVAAIGLWSYSVTYLDRGMTQEVSTNDAWAHDLRLAAIFAVISSLWLMLAGRAPLAVPSGIAVVAMITADLYLFQLRLTGPGIAFMLGAGGLLIVCGAWMAGRLLGRFRSLDGTRQHSHAVMAVLTAFAAPAVALHLFAQGDPFTPAAGSPRYEAVTFAVITLLTILAAVHALAARESASQPVIAIILALAAAAVVSTTATVYIGQYLAAMFAGPCFVVLAIVLIRPHGNASRRAILALAAVASAPPLFYLSLLSSAILAEPLISGMGYGVLNRQPPMMPGAVAMGVVIASAVAARLVSLPSSLSLQARESVPTQLGVNH